MQSPIDTRARKGEIPWTAKDLHRAMQEAGRRGPGTVMSRLCHEYGDDVGMAHFVRLMATSAFVEGHQEPLKLMNLCHDDEHGRFMNGGLLHALATLAFTRNRAGANEAPRWELDLAQVIACGRAVNALPDSSASGVTKG